MHQQSFLGKWVRIALIFPADSHSLSEDDKKEIPPPHHPFIQIPEESHCYLHILLISKSESIIEILRWREPQLRLHIYSAVMSIGADHQRR